MSDESPGRERARWRGLGLLLSLPLALKWRLRFAWQGAGARTGLLRDHDPVIVAEVLRCSRLLPGEVERISRQTNLPEFALRMIHEHPRWSRFPRVRRNLALNPRMPFAEAGNLLRELSDCELEYAACSARVTAQIARRAAELLAERRGSAEGG